MAKYATKNCLGLFRLHAVAKINRSKTPSGLSIWQKGMSINFLWIKL
jgi:hypothetical protein